MKTLPKNLKGARRTKKIPMFRVSSSASPYFYLHNVLPVLNKHSVVELVISDGGCLQVVSAFICVFHQTIIKSSNFQACNCDFPSDLLYIAMIMLKIHVKHSHTCG